MIADDNTVLLDDVPPHRIASRVREAASHVWACWWWALRAHVAAVYGFPRSALEAPPAEWLRPLAAPPPPLPRRRGPC